MAEPNWTQLLIPLTEIDVPHVLGHWAWLVDRPVKPLMLNRFGDWFLELPGGGVFRLDILEGTLDQLCSTVDEFHERRVQDDALLDWFQDGMVYAVYESGLVPGRGQGFGYRAPPIIGGSMDRPNVTIVEVAGWQLFMSKLHEQLCTLPPETRVQAIDLDEMGNLTLRTEKA